MMKININYRPFVLLAVVCLVFGTKTTLGEVIEKSKHISKAFPISSTTEIQISNKYGNIHIVTWEKDSVRFDIDVLVKANKQSKADKIYDYIDFEFTGTEYYVIAQTIFRDNKKSLWNELSDIASTLFSSENAAQIDYTVYLPENNPLKLTNKFGSIYTTNHTHEVEIVLSNGDLKAHDFMGRTKINLEFGTATINKIETGNLVIRYSEFTLDYGGNIGLISKSSTINIEELDELDIDTRRDKLYFTTVNKVIGKSSFSYFNIKELTEIILLTTKYGEININLLGESFQLLNFNSSYTDITLQVPIAFSCDLEINHNHRTILNYPSAFKNVRKKVKNAKEETYVTYGPVGDPDNDPAKIDINTKSGKITILQL